MGEHNIVVAGAPDMRHGRWWYKCTKCGKSDWIASYGTKEQLNFYYDECKQ